MDYQENDKLDDKDPKKRIRKMVGKNIKKLREDRKLTQNYLSDKLGLSSTGHFSLIEKGERGLPSDKIIKLAEILGVHPSVFFTEKQTSLEYAHLMGLLSTILLTEIKPPSFEALKILIKSVAKECENKT